MRIIAHAIISVILVVLAAQPLRGETSFTLTTGNDILAGNRLDDDLYTAALGATIRFETGHLTLEERLFTDREADVRFDETWVLAGFQPHRRGSWAGKWAERWGLELEAGAVHVGRGLLGESAQNQIHRLIGSDEVDLEYVTNDEIHAVVGARVTRPLHRRQTFGVEAYAEARAAVGFQQYALAKIRADWQPHPGMRLYAGLGARAGSTERAELEPWYDGFGLAGEAGVLLLDRIDLSWSYNQYGTGAGHLHLGYRVRLPGGSRGVRPY